METAGAPLARQGSAFQQIAQALAGYDADRQHKPHRRELRRPKFKPLVLSAIPTAAVRRVGDSFECFIGSEHVHCRGEHSSPDRAWLCLARFVASGAMK